MHADVMFCYSACDDLLTEEAVLHFVVVSFPIVLVVDRDSNCKDISLTLH